MNNKILILLALLLVTGCEGVTQMSNLKLSSPAFENNANIPVKYTAQGQDTNPQLTIENIPPSAESLVLIMDDPDAPEQTWIHWIVFNIPASITRIEEDSVPTAAKQGMNSWGRFEYGGPNPPSGTHRYFFKLYALDTMLDLSQPHKEDVEKAMRGHVVGQTQLIGLYSKG